MPDGNFNSLPIPFKTTTLEQDVSTLQQDVSDLEDDLSDEVTNRTSSVNAVQTQLNRQVQLFNTTTVPVSTGADTATGTLSASIYNYNAVVVVFQVSSYKAMMYYPKLEYGTGWFDIPLLYNDSWKAYLDMHFTSGTECEFVIRGLTGWDESTTKRLTIYGIQ